MGKPTRRNRRVRNFHLPPEEICNYLRVVCYDALDGSAKLACFATAHFQLSLAKGNLATSRPSVEHLIAQLLEHEDFFGVVMLVKDRDTLTRIAPATPVEFACSPQISDSECIDLLFGALTGKVGRMQHEATSTVAH